MTIALYGLLALVVGLILGWNGHTMYYRVFVLRRAHCGWLSWREEDVAQEFEAARELADEIKNLSTAATVSVTELVDTADELFRASRAYVERQTHVGQVITDDLAELINATAKYMALEQRRDTMRSAPAGVPQ